MAHSYHKFTGWDVEDLFSEASMAYCLIISKYNGSVALSTFLWTGISNHLRNYIKKENFRPKLIFMETCPEIAYEFPEETEIAPETSLEPFFEEIETDPDKYLTNGYKLKFKPLNAFLKDLGYNPQESLIIFKKIESNLNSYLYNRV